MHGGPYSSGSSTNEPTHRASAAARDSRARRRPAGVGQAAAQFFHHAARALGAVGVRRQRALRSRRASPVRGLADRGPRPRGSRPPAERPADAAALACRCPASSAAGPSRPRATLGARGPAPRRRRPCRFGPIAEPAAVALRLLALAPWPSPFRSPSASSMSPCASSKPFSPFMPSAFSCFCISARRLRSAPLALLQRRHWPDRPGRSGRVAAERLALIVAERVVAQRLLVAQQLVEFVELLAHFAARRVGLGVAGAPHVLEHVLQFVEHRLGVLARAVARHVLDAVEHRLEVLLRQSGVGVVRRARRPAWRGRAYSARRPRAIPASGLRISSSLAPRCSASRSFCSAARKSRCACEASPSSSLQRHRPQQIGDREQVGVAVRVGEPRCAGAQAEIDAGRRLRTVRARSSARRSPWRRAAVRGRGRGSSARRCSTSARASGLWNSALRQRERRRRAGADLAGDAGRLERHDDLGAGPRVFGEVAGRARFAGSVGRARQPQRQLRRRDRARAAAARRRPAWRTRPRRRRFHSGRRANNAASASR